MCCINHICQNWHYYLFWIILNLISVIATVYIIIIFWIPIVFICMIDNYIFIICFIPVLNSLLLLFPFESGVLLIVLTLVTTFFLSCHFHYLSLLIVQVLLFPFSLSRMFLFFSYYAICDTTATSPNSEEATKKMWEKKKLK